MEITETTRTLRYAVINSQFLTPFSWETKTKIPAEKTTASAFVLLLSLDVKFEYISQKNNQYFNTHCKISPTLDKDLQSIMFDAQIFL